VSQQNTAVSLASIIAQIEAIDGNGFNFGPRYFADLELADRERRRTASLLLAGCDLARQIYLEKLQMHRNGETHCAWCRCALTELRHVEAIGSKLVHHACAREFDAFVYEVSDTGRRVLDEQDGAA
jgi:hypothetical protein